MGNLKMYKYTHVGTKDLIEQYINSALETLDALLDISQRAKCDGLESKHILEQVLAARQAFGRSALLLSGGATFGMNHIGVLKCLWEARLLPRIISGASAGSIVSAVLCTRTDEEIPELLETFCTGDVAVFEEEGNADTIWNKIARFLKFGALFDMAHLTRVMTEMLGDMTFQEGYNRTRRILNICVSSASLYELPRLLNYVTAPNVLIRSAVTASCSVPFIFTAASLLAKNPKTGLVEPWNPSPQRWIDGSVDNDLPMTRLAEMFNVNHFIVSQVNPHVVPFLIKEEDSVSWEAQQSSATVSAGPTWLHSMTDLAKGEALHRMQMMVELGIFPNLLTKAVSVLSQKYSGDITILPEISYADFPRMLSNPTEEFMHQAMLTGERATWPKLSRIRNHCAIELALDDAVQKLRARVVFSQSQVDLRLDATSSRIANARQYSWKRNSADNKTIKRQRTISQASTASDPLAIAAMQKDGVTRRIPLRDSSRRKQYTQSLHQNQLPADFSPIASNDGSPAQHFSPAIIPHIDLLSSEAETSHTLTSEESESELSSSSTMSPHPSPTQQPWPGRHLFPYASQPVTPAGDRLATAFLPLLPSSRSPSHYPHTSQNSPTFSKSPFIAFNDEPPSPKSDRRVSSPERIYKRLFHSGGGRSRARNREASVAPATAAATPSPPGGPPTKERKEKRFAALGLQLDISGSHGMVLRKKKDRAGQ